MLYQFGNGIYLYFYYVNVNDNDGMYQIITIDVLVLFKTSKMFFFDAGKELYELFCYCLEPLLNGLLHDYYDSILYRYYYIY